METKIKVTTVVRVSRLDPEEWQANKRHLYVGRYQQIRSGRHTGKIWWPQGWGNGFRPDFDSYDREEALRHCVEAYERDLIERVRRQGRQLIQPLQQLAGKVLGCWCADWDGVSQPRPNCHAAVLADWVNRMQAGERPWEVFA
jgi:hypothetical protein